MLPLLALALAGAVSAWRPGWTALPARVLYRLGALLLLACTVTGAVLFSLSLDPPVRGALLRWASPQTRLFDLLGAWLRSPALTDVVLLLIAVGAVSCADLLAPGSLRPSRIRSRALACSGAIRPLLPGALVLILLLLAWHDVILATLGEPGRAALTAIGNLAAVLPGRPGAGASAGLSGAPPGMPDPAVPALCWWLSATYLCLRQALTAGTGGRRWLAAPVLAALLAVVARPLAVAVAPAAFLLAVVAVAATTLRDARRAGREPLPALRPLFERATLLAILCLALALRWTPRMADPFVSDAGGYFEMARDFHARVREQGTNPIALAYLNIHPASREPLYILLLRGVFDLIGAAPLHQRYLTVFASVAGVALTYAVGRVSLGAVAGLGAALMLAVEPWHIVVSGLGLRDEWAMLFVYGLALLVILPLRGGPMLSVLAGALAAAAVLTRIDAGPVVAFLLLVWSVRLWLAGGRAWQLAAVGWVTLGALVAPLILGYRMRTGEALAPLGSSLGGDIRASMTPLLKGEMAPLEVLRYVGAGAVEMYAGTIFSGIAAYAGPFAGAVLALLVGAFVAGLAGVALRGPRLLAALAVLGAFAPPFIYIAGIARLGGPGTGYTDRYTYLILPAVLSVCAWALGRLAARAGTVPALTRPGSGGAGR